MQATTTQRSQGLTIQNIAVLENLFIQQIRISRRQIKTLAQFWDVDLATIHSWLEMRHRLLGISTTPRKSIPKYDQADSSLHLPSAANRVASADVPYISPNELTPSLSSVSSSSKMSIEFLLN